MNTEVDCGLGRAGGEMDGCRAGEEWEWEVEAGGWEGCGGVAEDGRDRSVSFRRSAAVPFSCGGGGVAVDVEVRGEV